MAFDDRSLDDYVDVAVRIADFRELHPGGSLQPLHPDEPWTTATLEGTAKDGKPFTATFIVYTAAAYRTPDDPRPGIGCAYEVFPGRTPYTAGSELQNAETAAWGRAIIAALASDSRAGVASRQEVRNRRAEREDEAAASNGARKPRTPRERPPVRPLAELPRNRDGRLSRSKITDEEFEAYGNMTAAQLKEHSKLQKGADRGSVPGMERLTEPDPDDQWADARPRLRVPEPAQPVVGVIVKHFERLGITDREERLVWTGRLAGRELSSSKDMTAGEARQVADKVARCRDLSALEEAREAAVAAGDGGQDG